MKRVVLFKSWSEEYASECRARGMEAVFVEPLQYAFVNEDTLRTALTEEGLWDALCVTSVRGVQAIARVRGEGPGAIMQPVYAVGAATARAVRALLGTEARGEAGSGAALGEQLATELAGGRRVLWPRGQLAGDALLAACNARGVHVHTVTVYETRPHSGLEEQLQRVIAEAAEGRVHALAMFSPSGAQLVLGGPHGASLRTLPLFGIGQTTAEAMASLHAPATCVADVPTAEALLQVIDKYFTTKQDTLPQ